MTRAQALAAMENPPYGSKELLEQDRSFVMKKLGFSSDEFDAYMSAAPVAHEHYPSDLRLYRFLEQCSKVFYK
jgi:hypothetical protein